jgi:superfamily II DNA or RNA helicase
MELRPYQAECSKAVLDAFGSNDSVLIVMPTGTGKTVTFADIIKKWLAMNPGLRVGVMAHREELVTQNARTIQKVTGIRPQIEMAQFEADDLFTGASDGQIVCTSVQSMCRENRLKRFDPSEFSLWITDEAHHCVPTNKSYHRVIEHFASDGRLKHLGCTATPDRADEKALGQMYQTVAFEMPLHEAIDQGWLCPIRQRYIRIEGLDLDKVNAFAGDLNQGQLEVEMLKDANFHRFTSALIQEAGKMPTLVFTVDVEHAQQTDHFINEYHKESPELVSVCITGGTNRELRRKWVAEFQARQRQYMTSCGVFLEGFDAPVAQMAGMGRPTKSRALFAQALGRITRPLPGVVDNPLWDDATERKAAIANSEKPFCLSLDFTGNCYRHKLISTADILGGEYDDEEIITKANKLAEERTKSNGAPIDVEELLEEAEALVREEQSRERLKVLAKARYTKVEVNPFDVLDISCTREPGWHKGRKATDGQKKALTNFGVPEAAQYSFWQAHNLLDNLIKRANEGKASYKQTRLLRKFGESADVTFKEASAIIDQIAQNNWQPRTNHGVGVS